MSRGKKQLQGIFNEINITPLTDIFLVLLVIMMIIAPMLDQTGLSLAVPTVAKSSNMTDDSKFITIKVDRTGNYFIDENKISFSDMSGKLRELSKIKTEGVVIVTDGNAIHQAIVQVMDAVRMAGIDKLTIMEQH